jgi:hypothetical protein
MSTSTATAPARTSDSTWLQLVQLSLAVGMVTLVVFAVVGTFFTTISGGDFRYTADYWYTGVGLPLTLMGVGHTLGVHKLQHGADGRLGTIGLWVNTLAMIELFAQLLASVVEGTEVRWGAAYPVFTLISFIGMSLLAAGSWRTGLLPKWMRPRGPRTHAGAALRVLPRLRHHADPAGSQPCRGIGAAPTCGVGGLNRRV